MLTIKDNRITFPIVMGGSKDKAVVSFTVFKSKNKIELWIEPLKPEITIKPGDYPYDEMIDKTEIVPRLIFSEKHQVATVLAQLTFIFKHWEKWMNVDEQKD